jgi:hypothetical protein
MSVYPTKEDRIFLKAVMDYIEGSSDFDTFIKNHDTIERKQLKEMAYFRGETHLLSLLLCKLPVHLGLKVMKEVNEFSYPVLSELGFGGSSGEFFRYKPGNVFRPTPKMIETCILLDIPMEYLARKSNFGYSLSPSSFMEYYLLGSEKEDFPKIIEEVISKPEKNRIIKGFVVKDVEQPMAKFVGQDLIMRIDKRKSFYTIEIFLKTKIMDKKTFEQMFAANLNFIHHAFLTGSLLRESHKLVIVGSYSNLQKKKMEEYISELKRHCILEIYPRIALNDFHLGDLELTKPEDFD